MQTSTSQTTTLQQSQKEPFMVATLIMPFLDFYCGTEDHLGSTRMVLDEDGGIKRAMMYQPYVAISNVVEMGATSTDPLRQKFTTKEFDEDGEDIANGVSGIEAYHFGARVYDPEVGVWMSTDPASQYWNAY